MSQDVKGYIDSSHSKVAMVEKGLFFDSEHMLAPQYEIINGIMKENGTNTRPLEDTAINVIPRAVAATQTFINFFFRGQIETSLSDDHETLTIRNISDPRWVNNASLLTFKSGGKFRVYYNTQNGTNVLLNTYGYTLTKDLTVGNIFTIDISNDIKNLALPNDSNITIVFDGNIGDNLGGLDNYGIGMRGLSVDVVKVKLEECTDTKLKGQVEKVKEWLLQNNRSNCVSFSSLNYAQYPKSIYKRDNRNCVVAGYKNTQIVRSLAGGRYSRLFAHELIDYFNNDVYHLTTNNDPKDTYSASVQVNPYSVSSAFNVSFTVRQYKNGNHYRTFVLSNLLTLKWFDGSSHVGYHHYDTWCNSNASLCNSLKNHVNSDSYDEIGYYELDWIVSEYNIANFINRISNALDVLYSQSSEPNASDKYPKDWLKHIVTWIETYDCSSNSNISKNIFYNEASINKNILKKH